MEDEVVLKQMKKYRFFSLAGIFLFLALLFFQYYLANEYNCSGPSYIPNIQKQEIDAFNSQFFSYEGKTSGSNTKALVTKLLANLGSYKDEPVRIPNIIYEDSESYTTISYNGIEDEETYKKEASEIRNKIISKKYYIIEIEISELTGFINIVKITKKEETENIENTVSNEIEVTNVIGETIY